MLHIFFSNVELNKIKLPCSYCVCISEGITTLISNSVGYTLHPLGKGVQFQSCVQSWQLKEAERDEGGHVVPVKGFQALLSNHLSGFDVTKDGELN